MVSNAVMTLPRGGYFVARPREIDSTNEEIQACRTGQLSRERHTQLALALEEKFQMLRCLPIEGNA